MSERTAEIRDHIELFQPYWKSSLDILGNISHKGTIPPEAITRVVVADPPSAVARDIDPVIEIEAVQMTKPKYNLLTRLLMGDDVSEKEYIASAMGVPVLEGVDAEEMVSDGDIKQVRDARNIPVDTVLSQDYVETVYETGV
jgi:hypothetical protein